MAAAVVVASAASARAQTFEPHELTLPGQLTLAPDVSALTGPIDEITLSPEPMTVSIELTDADRFELTAQSEGDENVTIRYCDVDDNCDEAFYALSVRLAVPITSETLRDTVTLGGDVITLCIPTDELPGSPNSASDDCADAAGTYVDFDLSQEPNCVSLKYRGIASGGSDTSCVVVCDDLGYCDTTTVIVTTIEPDSYPDLEAEFVILEGEGGTFEVDITAFADPIHGFTNRCPDAAASFVDFDLDADTGELEYYALSVGEARACVVATDSEGRTQLTTVTVRVVARPALSDTLRLRVGDEREYCFAAYRLDTDAVTLSDECPAGDAVAAFDATGGNCATITGLSAGLRELCLVACDGRGACDRVSLLVEILDPADDRLPVANDDAYRVEIGDFLQLDVLANDENLDGVNAVTLIREPNLGFAATINSTTLEYSREEGECLVDTLIYEICNDFGCDRATVVLDVSCSARPPIETLVGFSPNGDGINDVFSIINLEFYPQNELKVYNRWGTRVFEATDYANDWNGLYDGRSLPDGTYFFVIEIEGEYISGCVQLRR